MSLISSIVSNIKLPKIDFKSSAGFVDTVKNLAKVAGDTFLKPSTDGKGIFQSEVSILGMRLPNPVEILAEKLLGEAGKKVSELGFDPSTIANLFTGKGGGAATVTTQPSGGSTTTPASTATTTTQSSSGSTNLTTTTSSSSSSGKTTKSTGADYADTIMSKFGGSLDSLDSSINGLINKGGELSQTEMLKLQQQMQKRNELYQMMSQIIAMEHETKKSIIQNIR